jgi:hypothetical protein
MPIRSDLRGFYKPPTWPAVRRRILERAGGIFALNGDYLGGAKCEQCGVPQYATVARAAGWWLKGSQPCINCMLHLNARRVRFFTCECEGVWIARPTGQQVPAAQFPLSIRRILTIVLTVAHLNHVAGDDRDENLAALCQWCHLHYDAEHHKETRSLRKDKGRPLL